MHVVVFFLFQLAQHTDWHGGLVIKQYMNKPDNGILFDAGNGTSSSTNSKNAASLMATMLIPTCVLLYVL
jgi:uncharacterized membrane protein